MPDFDSEGVAAVGHKLLKIQREVPGPSHQETMDVLSDFAYLLQFQEELEESETMQRQAWKLSEEVNEHRHLTLKYMSRLAQVLYERGKFEEAVSVAMDSLTMRTEMLGPEHQTVIVGKSDLALYLGGAGRVDEAIEMNRDALTLCGRFYGPDHPNTLTFSIQPCLSSHQGREV